MRRTAVLLITLGASACEVRNPAYRGRELDSDLDATVSRDTRLVLRRDAAAPADLRAPVDARQPAPADLNQPAPADLNQPAPADLRQPAPADLNQPAPADLRETILRDVADASDAAGAPGQQGDAGVPVVGLKGEYFTNRTLTGTPRVSRVDRAIEFDWLFGAPASSLPFDGFSVRWTGTVSARYSELYTIHAWSDDGVRVWVDDVLVIDRWNQQTATESRGTVPLQANRRHTIKVEYFESTEFARIRVAWSSASQPKETIPSSRLTP